jgi:antitoxin (DNA-binding transcriptional repressor) of toxin-antitoxin stability system
MKAKSSIPEVILRHGKPVAVIVGIRQYEELLKRLEDIDDLRELAAMRRKPVKFRKLEEFLKEYSPDA